MPQPHWVAEWLDKRGPKSVSKPSLPPTLPLEGPTTSRDAARINRVAAGLADLKLWLRDLVRQGIAETPSLGYRYWDDMAARMVDAQAPGAARQLREMAGITASGGDWAAQLLRKIALLHLLIAGFDRMDQLSSDTHSDVKTALGWTISQAHLVHKDGDADSWTVVGQRITEEDRLKSRRTWLFGEHDGSYALLLHFAHGNAQFENIPAPGAALDGELVHYPSAHPQRALMKEYSVATWARQTRCSGSAIGTAFQSYAEAISINPWLERFPMCLSSIIPLSNGTQRMLIDSELNSVPISPAFNRFWNLLSFSGGCAVTIFGEWDGMSFWPLTVIDNGQVKTL